MSPRAKNKHDSARYNASAPSPYGSRVSLIQPCCLPHPEDIVPKFPVSVSVSHKAEEQAGSGPDICYVNGLVPFPCQRMATIEIGSNGCGTPPEHVHNRASANKPGRRGAAAASALGTGVEMN